MKEHLYTLIEALMRNDEESAKAALSEAMKVKSTLKLKDQVQHRPSANKSGDAHE